MMWSGSDDRLGQSFNRQSCCIHIQPLLPDKDMSVSCPSEVTVWSEGNIASARKATGRRALQVMAVLDAMPSSNLRPEDETEVEASRVYRTTYMFSATMPPSVERLARKCVAGFRGSCADAVHSCHLASRTPLCILVCLWCEDWCDGRAPHNTQAATYRAQSVCSKPV